MTGRKSPHNGFGGNRLRNGKSHQKTTSSKVKSPPELSYETQLRKSDWNKLRRRGIVKWLDSTRMPYGFITMGNNVGFFHVKNVHGGEDYTPKPGDEVSFIYDEYEKGAMDVQVLPTLSNLPETPDIPTREVESHSRDESWETVDSENEEPASSRPRFDLLNPGAKRIIPSSSGTIIPSVPSVPVHSRPTPYNFGTIKSCNWNFSLCGYIILDNTHMDVPFRPADRIWAQQFKPGSRVTFELEFDTQGNQQAINVFPYHDALSPRDPNDSDY